MEGYNEKTLKEIKEFLTLHQGYYYTRIFTNKKATPFYAQIITKDNQSKIQITTQTRRIFTLPDKLFKDYYELSIRRENREEGITKESAKLSQFQVYYFGLIYWCSFQKEQPSVEDADRFLDR